MRLYLSSFRNGDHIDELLRMRRTDRPACTVMNAIDEASPAERLAAVQDEHERLAQAGLVCEELDLRDHFGGNSGELEDRLRTYEIVWLRGGNVFALRAALRLSGADAALARMLAEDAIIYAGYSAGPCCLAHSLRGLEVCDDADAPRRLYGVEPIWEGLGVLDVAFVPHIDSPGHPETALLDKVADHYRRTGVPHITLRDGQALIVEGRRRRLLG